MRLESALSACMANRLVQSPVQPSAQRRLYFKLVFTVPISSMKPWKEPQKVLLQEPPDPQF